MITAYDMAAISNANAVELNEILIDILMNINAEAELGLFEYVHDFHKDMTASLKRKIMDRLSDAGYNAYCMHKSEYEYVVDKATSLVIQW